MIRIIFVLTVCLLSACATQEKNAVVALGDRSVSEGSREQARDRYETKSHAVPKSVKLLLREAEEAIENGALETAQRKLDRAQRLAPAHSRTYLLLGRVQTELGNVHKARHMMKRALSLAINRSQRSAAKREIENLNELESSEDE